MKNNFVCTILLNFCLFQHFRKNVKTYNIYRSKTYTARYLILQNKMYRYYKNVLHIFFLCRQVLNKILLQQKTLSLHKVLLKNFLLYHYYSYKRAIKGRFNKI